MEPGRFPGAFTVNYTSEKAAFTSKAVLGVFQIGTMNELSIELRYAAQLISDDNFKRYIRANQFGSSVLALAYIAVGVYDITIFDECITLLDPATELPKPLQRACLYLTPSLLIPISIGLTASVIYLLVQIKQHFNRQVLMTEEGRVKTIFIVFTVTYVTRAVFLFLLSFFGSKALLDFTISYFVLLSFWDVLPLTLIMFYHRTCFEAQQRQLEQDLQDAQSEDSASSSSSSSSSPSQSSDQEKLRDTETSSNLDYLKDSILEQRMADIQAQQDAESR